MSYTQNLTFDLGRLPDETLTELLEAAPAGGRTHFAIEAEIERRQDKPIRNRLLKPSGSSKAVYFVHSGTLTPDGRVVDATYTRLVNAFGELVNEERLTADWLTTNPEWLS